MRKKRIGGILGQCFLSLSLLTGCACQRQEIVPTSECSSSSEREERMDPLTDRSDEPEFSEGSSGSAASKSQKALQIHGV